VAAVEPDPWDLLGASAAPATDTRAMSVETIVILRAELARLGRDPKATARERAAVATSLTSAVRMLSKLDGSNEISEVAICRSKPFRESCKVLKEALRPYPEAARAVARALCQWAGIDMERELGRR
jgi:hypothetical protein